MEITADAITDYYYQHLEIHYLQCCKLGVWGSIIIAPSLPMKHSSLGYTATIFSNSRVTASRKCHQVENVTKSKNRELAYV